MRQDIRYIYKVKNSENGRVYIGMTSRPEQRFKMHISQLKHKTHPCELMQEDFDNFGEDAFSMEILEEIEYRAQKSRNERDWMIKYKTYDERYGYNYADLMMNPVRKAKGLPYKISPKKGRILNKEVKHGKTHGND